VFDRLQADLKAHPILAAEPVSTSEVDSIEGRAGFLLPRSYREFVQRFGAAIVGPYPVYGKRAAEAMGAAEACVIEITRRFRSDGWPIPACALVISTDHAGNPFTMAADGSVGRFDHDSGNQELVASSFEHFTDWCISH
jgi:hypothetical protein